MISPSLPPRAAIVILCCLAALLAACSRTQPAGRDPVSAANAFFATLATGDPHDAYDSAAFGFQAAQSYDGFLSNARSLGLIGGKPPTWSSKQIDTAEAHLDGTILGSYGTPVSISVTMTPDGNTWKLFTLKTGIGQAPSENRFSLVGKNSDFNDVYHQPMPSSRQLDDLVRKTMLDFATAIQKADFHPFYLSVSEEWRNGETASGGAASGVTENMLKNHFQGFIDGKVNLTPVANMTPVYDVPPSLNQDGLLHVQGHFNTKPYRLNFEFEYIYELPWWKLFGIDVNLTQ